MQTSGDFLAEIEAIPAIDIRTHIRADAPVAGDLSEIALYHDVQTELQSIGVPAEVFENQNAKKRVIEAAKYVDRIPNTTTYWCLTRILTDLYAAGPLHGCDIDDLYASVEKTAADPTWLATVLEKANVAKVFHTCPWQSKLPKASDVFLPTLRLDSLINEAHMSRTLNQLTEVTGQTVYEVADLKKAVIALFRRAVDAGVVAVGASFDPMVDFEEGNRDSADRILSLVLLGQKANRDDRKALRSYVMDLVLTECASHGIPFQLMLGIRHRPRADRYITASEPGMVTGYTDLFTRHSGARFDVMTSNEALCHQLTVVGRNYRNVYFSGCWWYLMFPTSIRKIIRQRVEMLPKTKSNGFFSDAYCAEWIYGKAKLARREMAFALSQMVDEGYLSRETALDVARHYLYENPKRIYKVE